MTKKKKIKKKEEDKILKVSISSESNMSMPKNFIVKIAEKLNLFANRKYNNHD